MIIKTIDVETTGFTPPDHAVCEIAVVNLISTRTDLAGAPIGWEVVPGDFNHWLVNPGRPMPPEASAIHHLVDEDFQKAEDLASIVRREINGDGDRPLLAAHSAKFEQLFLPPELLGPAEWICTYKAALRLWPEAPSHSNQALRYWRRPHGLDRAIATPAHRAFPDAYVTAHLLRDMLELASVEQLVAWSSQPALQVRCHIGAVWRGKKWTEVDDGFLYWVSQRDFDEDVLFTVRHEMERREQEARQHQDAGETA